MQYGEPEGALPEVPTVDEVAAAFPVPLATLVPQPGVREIGVNTTSSSRNGGPFALETAAIMFAVLRNPGDLDDPVNHVEPPPGIEAALADPSPLLPAAVLEWMRWLRFPRAQEAVQTIVRRDGQPLADELALHMRNTIGNSFREQRDPTPFEPGSFVDPPSAADAVTASVVVDGVEVPGIRIDDEHVLGLGVDLGDALAAVVWPKHLLPLVRLELTRKPRPGPPGQAAARGR